MQSNKQNNAVKEATATVDENTVTKKQNREMKGVWVSFLSLDIENTDMTQNDFKNKFESIVKKTVQGGFNTLIVQVRPFGDALYKSKIFPSSHIVTGEQGKSLSYDPLQIMVDMCHKNDLEIHAWVNPYRIKTEKTPKTLSDDNPYVKDKSLGVEWDNAIYYKPSSPEAQKLIVDGVREIVTNYDVDGVQFDDYFYPTEDKKFDEEDYKSYVDNLKNSDSALSLEKWRMQNVNMLVSEVYRVVHKCGKDVVFGISPQGNLKNNDKLYADVNTWCTVDGYIDYICPQIYFSLDNPALTFEDSLKEWLSIKKHSSLKLYAGLAGYKGGTDADEGTWLDNNDILKQELEIIKEKKLDGFMLYSYESLISDENKEEIENVIKYIASSEIAINATADSSKNKSNTIL